SAYVPRRKAPAARRISGFTPVSFSSARWQAAQSSRWAIKSACSSSGSAPASNCWRRSTGGQEEGTAMMNPFEPGSLRFHLLNLFRQPGEDTALGHVDGADRHPQPGGDLGGALALDGGAPERLPGVPRKVVADLGGRHAEELLLVFLFPDGFLVRLGAGL